MRANNSALKVFLLGIDATSLSYLQENIDALPHFANLLRKGRLVKPESPAEYMNAMVWQGFASGLPPGELGHYFPFQWDPAAMRFHPMKDDPRLYYEPFWNDLEAKGIKTVVIDATAVPVRPDAPGIQIIDWNSQCNLAATVNCPNIFREIQRKFGTKPIKDEIPVRKSRRMLSRFRDDLIKSLRLKTDAVIWLMRTHEWQFFLAGYFEGHRAGHTLWPLWDDFTSDPPEEALLDVYREIDTQIGRIEAELDLTQTALVVFSMHGMAPGYAQDHFLPPILDRVNAAYLEETGRARPLYQGPRITRTLRQTVPPSVQMAVRKLVGQKVQDWLVDREWRGGKDWNWTPGFPVPSGGDTGFIRLNIKGRERDGFLSPEEEGRYVDFLCNSLRELRVAGTNEPLVREIVLAKDAFPGPRSYLLPDLIVRWKPERPAKEICSERLGTIKAELKTGRGAVHTGEGFAILAGALERMDNQIPEINDIRDYRTFVTELLCA